MSTVVFDAEFVKELEEDPEGLLIDLGIEPTKELLAAIRAINTEALMQVAQTYGLRHRSKAEVELVFP